MSRQAIAFIVTNKIPLKIIAKTISVFPNTYVYLLNSKP